VSFVAITFCVVSQRVFIVVSVYVVIDSVRKLLVTPPYFSLMKLLKSGSSYKNQFRLFVCLFAGGDLRSGAFHGAVRASLQRLQQQ
jgi:hypothetical protein